MTPPLSDPAALALGKTLCQRRKALGISMAAAAEAAGMSRYTWHKMERGDPRVALGFLLAAARVLGMQCDLTLQDQKHAAVEASPDPSDWLPLVIRLADYPGLQRLAWQLREGVETLTPREAWGLYQRNGRHLDPERLQPEERALMQGLRRTFGGDADDV